MRGLWWNVGLLALGTALAAAGQTAASLTDAQALLAARQYAAARAAFEGLLHSVPQSADARAGLAAAAIGEALEATKAQHPQRALVILDEASREIPENPEVALDLGVEATMLHQFTLAETSLATANRLRPGNARTLYAMARLSTEQGDQAEAVERFKAYLQVQPGDASAWYGLGHVYSMQQKDDDARAAFERSVALQPVQTESYYQLGELALNAHRDDEARLMFARALARQPDHAGALTGMGEVQLRAKDYVAAEQTLLAAERSDPSYETPHYFRGLALSHLGRKEEAAAELAHGDARQHATRPADAPAAPLH